jgi:hypothetical protein
LLLSHFSYFFRWARPFLSGWTCCPRIFRMLGFDHFYISLSFPTRWSLYSSWCSGTCRDWYLSLLSCTMGYSSIIIWNCLITCLVFQKFTSPIISSNVVFFDRLTTWARIYFASNRCSFGCYVNMSSLLCSPTTRAWLLGRPNTPSFCYPPPIFLQGFFWYLRWLYIIMSNKC